ncbi:MAG: NAD-glutamate dehydrogenase, partial [Propionibacterium sp.]|nr:NAD-glutamate dehydrogenase [Propionibacterium sp.]
LGVEVLDERPFEFKLRGRDVYLYDFGLKLSGAADRRPEWTPELQARFIDTFDATYRGWAESGKFNRLVMTGGLTWQEIAWLRAISRYLVQAGIPYSQPYVAATLNDNPEIAAALVAAFRAKFDPSLTFADAQTRADAVAEAFSGIEQQLAEVASLDADRILRMFLAVLRAMIRTNAFQPGAPAHAFKVLPRELGLLPEPRPRFEIFVYSPRVQGVHLRFGSVARGGLRWSDRREDFRTEVLGLVKAQMVKNSVIVPSGAKGGFVPQSLPDPNLDRGAWLAEGVACYQVFIASLLTVTDNIVAGEVVPPPDVVRWDGDDPYLVVAADKGTATFSDIANRISLERGFWLGDAFASGGSAGYDHKAMGITARGAWESVKRHFIELGRDCQAEDFTCVGIGDMAGDVFGNGMLRSRHTRLVAAFNHLHVFLDPNPDAERSFAERERLFGLPRSSWADYDPALISPGGGVFPRTLKSVPISAEARAALGLDEGVTRLTPAELINAILKAPVDLLWNGGIGTYVKASGETNADVGDKANDAVRVNGAEVRALCAGEGGNLGWTQLGRIEYAVAGGRINTDFIDNSAGVDTSDHEVNIKILLTELTREGDLTLKQRNTTLAAMTDDVARQV